MGSAFSQDKSINIEELIQNSSFEEKAYCPVNFNQQSLNQIKSWWQAGRGTPDYFNVCSEKAGVPSNTFGEQEARDGEAYAGLVTYSAGKKNYREYLQSKLKRPLQSGEKICVEYFVSTGDKSRYVTDGIGLHFSKGKIKGKGDKLVDARPQIRNLNLNLLDGFGTWVKISDMFIAQGGEQYITMGNFDSDVMTTVLKRTDNDPSLNKWSYIYIDDLSVYPVQNREECSCANDIISKTITDPPKQLSESRQIEISFVTFDFDESTLDQETKDKLDEVAGAMYKNNSLFVNVVGHTDIMGAEEYNLKLSKERANSVLDYLKFKGVDPVRLKIDYKGSKMPKAPNSTEEGRQQNRRVEFEILQYSFEKVVSK